VYFCYNGEEEPIAKMQVKFNDGILEKPGKSPQYFIKPGENESAYQIGKPITSWNFEFNKPT